MEVVPTAPQSASCHEKRTGESGTHFHKQLVTVDMAHLFLRLWPNGHWCMQHDIHTTLLKELLSTPVLLSKYFEHTGKSRHEYIHCLGKPTCFVWMWKRAASVNSTPNNYQRFEDTRNLADGATAVLYFIRVSHGHFRLQSSPTQIKILNRDRKWLCDTGTVKPRYNKVFTYLQLLVHRIPLARLWLPA